MKTKTFFLLLALIVSINSFCTVHIINSSGNTFAPANITINLGDTIQFVIGSNHDAREVSQSTYNANGSAALSGGFQTAFGGGLVLPSQLTTGIHYYVCTPHASVGMKGTITVQNPSDVEEQLSTKILVYPNPAQNQIFINAKFFADAGSGTFIKLVDESSNVVLHKNVSANEWQSVVTMDVKDFAGGAYLLILSNANEQMAKRIILQK